MINEQFYKMLKLTKYSFSLRGDITFEFEPPINCDNIKLNINTLYSRDMTIDKILQINSRQNTHA